MNSNSDSFNYANLHIIIYSDSTRIRTVGRDYVHLFVLSSELVNVRSDRGGA